MLACSLKVSFQAYNTLKTNVHMFDGDIGVVSRIHKSTEKSLHGENTHWKFYENQQVYL